MLAFFDSKGLVYANFMTKGKTVNTMYIIEALTRFSRILKEKRSAMMARTGGFMGKMRLCTLSLW